MYGAHVSIFYARAETITTSLSPLTHHFLPYNATSLKLQPGGPGYELVYSTTAIPEYLKSLTPAATLEAGFAAIAEHEQTLIQPLLTYLKSKEARGVRIVGDEAAGPSRVPTISFVVVGPQRKDSRDIVKIFDQAGNVSFVFGILLCFLCLLSSIFCLLLLLLLSFSIFHGPDKRVPEHLGFAMHSIFRIHSESRIQVATSQPCASLCRVVRYAYSVAAHRSGSVTVIFTPGPSSTACNPRLILQMR